MKHIKHLLDLFSGRNVPQIISYIYEWASIKEATKNSLQYVFWLGHHMHQDAFVFTMHMICGNMRSKPPLKMVKVIRLKLDFETHWTPYI